MPPRPSLSPPNTAPAAPNAAGISPAAPAAAASADARLDTAGIAAPSAATAAAAAVAEVASRAAAAPACWNPFASTRALMLTSLRSSCSSWACSARSLTSAAAMSASTLGDALESLSRWIRLPSRKSSDSARAILRSTSGDGFSLRSASSRRLTWSSLSSAVRISASTCGFVFCACRRCSWACACWICALSCADSSSAFGLARALSSRPTLRVASSTASARRRNTCWARSRAPMEKPRLLSVLPATRHLLGALLVDDGWGYAVVGAGRALAGRAARLSANQAAGGAHLRLRLGRLGLGGLLHGRPRVGVLVGVLVGAVQFADGLDQLHDVHRLQVRPRGVLAGAHLGQQHHRGQRGAVHLPDAGEELPGGQAGALLDEHRLGQRQAVVEGVDRVVVAEPKLHGVPLPLIW